MNIYLGSWEPCTCLTESVETLPAYPLHDYRAWNVELLNIGSMKQQFTAIELCISATDEESRGVPRQEQPASCAGRTPVELERREEAPCRRHRLLCHLSGEFLLCYSFSQLLLSHVD